MEKLFFTLISLWIGFWAGRTFEVIFKNTERRKNGEDCTKK